MDQLVSISTAETFDINAYVDEVKKPLNGNCGSSNAIVSGNPRLSSTQIKVDNSSTSTLPLWYV